MNQEFSISNQNEKPIPGSSLIAQGFGVASFLILQLIGSLFPLLPLRSFSHPAGWIAANFWGAPCEVGENQSLWIQHPALSVEVSNACSGFTFFSILLAFLIGILYFRIGKVNWQVVAAWLPVIYLVGLACNTSRILLSVECRLLTDGWFPENFQAILHTTIGIAVFLPFLLTFWIVINKLYGHTQSH